MTARLRDQIPGELRALPQWVGWRWETRDGKRTKPPFTADGSRPASCDDPTTWATFEAVCAGIEARKLSGAGFQAREGQGYTGVDYDHCRDPKTGKIDPAAQRIIEHFNSYTEVSPSGTGIRIFIKGTKPGPRCRKGALEIYDRSRYFTVTGQHIKGTPRTIEDRQQELGALYLELWPEKPASNGHTAPSGMGLTAWEVIALASRAKNGGKFEALMRGDTAEYGGDDSAADQALCNLVAFYSRDPGVIAQVVQQSALYRAKWERADYRVRTIERALTSVTETYTPPREAPRTATTAPSSRAQEAEESAAVLAPIPDYPVEVLPAPMRRLVETAGLPPTLVAGAAMAALAAAVGARATLEYQATWRERAILWVPLLAPRGAGKSPSQAIAFAPLRDHDRQAWGSYREELDAWRRGDSKSRGDRPIDPTICTGDSTLEALARLLDDRPAVAVDADELKDWLLSLGQYKRGGGGDRARVLSLWTGSPWPYRRVTGEVNILISEPTVVICGGLQPALHDLLGGEQDGQRPRWLPHLSARPDSVRPSRPDVLPWTRLLGGGLIPARAQERVWSLDSRARQRFESLRARWKRQATDDETASTSAALDKADVHLLRVALVLAEAEHPVQGGTIGAELLERAAIVIDYTLDCWRALPEQGGLSLSRTDEKLDQGVDRMRSWLEEHGGSATKRTLLRSAVAGVQTAADLDLLLRRFQARYPGTITQEVPSHGGPVATVVRSPRRRTPPPTVVSTDNDGRGEPGPAGSSSEFAPGPETHQPDVVSTTDNGSTDNGSTDNGEGDFVTVPVPPPAPAPAAEPPTSRRWM